MMLRISSLPGSTIDCTDTQTEFNKIGVSVTGFIQNINKYGSFRKCIYRVIEILISIRIT
jgi:hypothetical protein